MNSQKAFISLPAILMVVLLSVGIVIGITLKKPITSFVKKPAIATDSGSINNIASNSATPSATVTPTNTPVPTFTPRATTIPTPSVTSTPFPSQNVSYTNLSYNFDIKPGAVEIHVKGPNGNLSSDVLVELRTQNEVNVFQNKTRPQVLNYVNKESPVTEFNDIPPGTYKIEAMYGSNWHQYNTVTVLSDKKAVIEITIQP